MTPLDGRGVSLHEAFPLSDFIDRRCYAREYTLWYAAALALRDFLAARPRWLPPAVWHHLPPFYVLKRRHEKTFRAYMTAYDTEWWQAKARQDAVLKEYAA